MLIFLFWSIFQTRISYWYEKKENYSTALCLGESYHSARTLSIWVRFIDHWKLRINLLKSKNICTCSIINSISRCRQRYIILRLFFSSLRSCYRLAIILLHKLSFHFSCLGRRRYGFGGFKSFQNLDHLFIFWSQSIFFLFFNTKE